MHRLEMLKTSRFGRPHPLDHRVPWRVTWQDQAKAIEPWSNNPECATKAVPGLIMTRLPYDANVSTHGLSDLQRA